MQNLFDVLCPNGSTGDFLPNLIVWGTDTLLKSERLDDVYKGVFTSREDNVYVFGKRFGN
ncbi:hypothetical protein PHO31112_02330 [Pandoraea horticolens]|uniref:Uncharacterized protein n=1 Tax=Pandoraea horticolens TaxID=2508298 RepID=A0A5E4V0I1_9BURK|nr:hypothetical protein PHO31112_02330 [Pandoraea horticolens]